MKIKNNSAKSGAVANREEIRRNTPAKTLPDLVKIGGKAMNVLLIGGSGHVGNHDAPLYEEPSQFSSPRPQSAQRHICGLYSRIRY